MFQSFRSSSSMSSYSSSSSTSSTSSSDNHSPRYTSIGFTPNGSDSLLDIFPQTSTSKASATAFPSWPQSEMLYSPPERKTSSYISDEDLFGLDDDSSELPYLSEAPAPPREAHHWAIQPQPVLPQLAPRPKVHFRKSPKKTSTRRSSKAMPAIRESSM
ncbi:hypothetical protein BDZ85DRAFT_257062 [Elsinoe ampelina]|uniref:Uncharacterized protein n=1 Tax=Elsinoe ampelina TaxID=302913 RepID=A0A6A6GNA6_9PEZI|nr:hypothetical protein BDZ85DRAFT_257062 [Elsinoe ampelina]